VTITVGVSIAIPEPFGEALRDQRRSFGDMMADRIPSHITLAPPLVVDETGLGDLDRDLGRLAAGFQPFAVSLLGTGTFRPVSPVVFVAVSQGIAQIEILAEGVRRAIGAPDPDFPFHPHVTVAHNVDDAALDRALAELSDFRCAFEVDAIHLYVDDPDHGWVPTSTFPLG
jgi:2'-5' RNA ligase